MSTLHLLNAPICHTPDLRYTTTRISRERAIQLAAVAKAADKLVSAIGHDGSAQVLSVLLDQPVAVNRVSMSYQPGDTAICLQLRQRQPEGVVLTAEQVEAIGYDLTLIETAPAPVLVIFGSAVQAAEQLCMGGRDEGHPVPRPGDIDVIYGGMDRQEARERVLQWARETGLDGEWSGPLLALDLHPELCWLSPASYTGHADLGDRVDFPARYEVSIPHPMGTNLPDVVVLAGKPKIKGLPVNSLAATIRRCAAEHLTAQQAGDQIAKFIANTRNGTCIILRTERGEDASYLEASLHGLRAAWKKLIEETVTSGRSLYGNTQVGREQCEHAICEHVDGYLRGVGRVLQRLLIGIPLATMERLRLASANSANDLHRQHGYIEIVRTPGAENIWQVRAGEFVLPATAAAAWLCDRVYLHDPTIAA